MDVNIFSEAENDYLLIKAKGNIVDTEEHKLLTQRFYSEIVKYRLKKIIIDVSEINFPNSLEFHNYIVEFYEKELPKQKDLLDTFHKMRLPKSTSARNYFKELRSRVGDECKKILPGSQIQDVTLEEVFSAFKIQENAGWTTSEEKEMARKTVCDLRKMLVIYIRYYTGINELAWPDSETAPS